MQLFFCVILIQQLIVCGISIIQKVFANLVLPRNDQKNCL
jgi:hypothetical protein